MLVRRVVISRGRAIGVEYERRGVPQLARAEGEVVVSAGAYGSPQLMMLSGVGPADHLREFGIEPQIDSPHVGLHLQEHPAAFCNWHSSEPRTLDDANHPRYLLQWLSSRKGKLSSTVAKAVIHRRSDPSKISPDFQIYFAPVYFSEHGFRKTGTPAITMGPDC